MHLESCHHLSDCLPHRYVKQRGDRGFPYMLLFFPAFSFLLSVPPTHTALPSDLPWALVHNFYSWGEEILNSCCHADTEPNHKTEKKIKRLAWEQRWDLPLVFMASTQPSVAFQCRHTGNLVVMFAGVQSRLASFFLYQIGHRQTCLHAA